jgi:hypothetical protein
MTTMIATATRIATASHIRHRGWKSVFIQITSYSGVLVGTEFQVTFLS